MASGIRVDTGFFMGTTKNSTMNLDLRLKNRKNPIKSRFGMIIAIYL